MIVPNQEITINWTRKNKQHYIDRGYIFTNIGDAFKVVVEDIMPRQEINLLCICDKCKIKFYMSNRRARNNEINNSLMLCKDCRYIENQNKRKTNSKFKYMYSDCVDVYKKILNGTFHEFPKGFMKNITIEDAAKLIKYLMKQKNIDNLDQDTLRDNKLYGLFSKFGFNNLMLEVFKDSKYPWELNMVSSGYWNDDQNVIDATHWFMGKLINEGLITEDDLFIKNLNYKKKMVEYKISGILDRFNSSVIRLFEFVYKDDFKPWFINVLSGYYSSEENCRKILEWFLDQLIKDGKIHSLKDLPTIMNYDLCKEYKIDKVINDRFNSSYFNALNFVKPNMWKRWEFNHVPLSFWANPHNVRDALVWGIEKLIDSDIISTVTDLNRFNINKLFTELNLGYLVRKYDIPFMLSMIYGEDFSYTNYTEYVSDIDGTRLDSLQEKELHNLLISNMDNVRKPSKSEKFTNEIHNEKYVPDWIIDGKVIVEYFGLYKENPHSELSKNYTLKTVRKSNYYARLLNYEFVGLYPSDLQNNYVGLIKKFAEKGIEIKV